MVKITYSFSSVLGIQKKVRRDVICHRSDWGGGYDQNVDGKRQIFETGKDPRTMNGRKLEIEEGKPICATRHSK